MKVSHLGGFLVGVTIGGVSVDAVMGNLDAHSGIYLAIAVLGATLLAVSFSKR